MGGIFRPFFSKFFHIYNNISPFLLSYTKKREKKKKNKNGFISHVLHHQGVGDLVSLFCVLFCGYTICYFSLNNIKKIIYTKDNQLSLFFCCRKFSFGSWRVEWAIERRSDHGYWKIVFLLYPPLSLP